MRIGHLGTDLNTLARPCWRKRKLPSKGAAEAQLRSLLNRDDGFTQDREALNVYQCKFCGGWHVGRKGFRSHKAKDR